jgi:hypothetical protein
MTDEWYYAHNGQQLGPVTITALRGLLANGQVKSSDLVWRDGMSNWTAAGETRELFAATPASAAYGTATPARQETAPVRPARREEEEPRDRWDERRPTRRRAAPQGMSTGAKVAIFGGIAAFLLLGLMLVVVIIIVVAANSTTTSSTYTTNAGTPPPAVNNPPPPAVNNPPPVVGVQPLVGPGVKNMSPPQFNSYNVELNFQGQNHDRLVFLQANQTVRVTVATLNWGGGLEPDVDLYIYDPFNNLVIVDVRVSKDSDVIFVTQHTGNYKIRVNLCGGNRASCIVRY